MTHLEELQELKNIQNDILTFIEITRQQNPQSSDELAQKNKDIEEHKKLLLNVEQKISNIHVRTATTYLLKDLENATNTEEFYATMHKHYNNIFSNKK